MLADENNDAIIEFDDTIVEVLCMVGSDKPGPLIRGKLFTVYSLLIFKNKFFRTYVGT